MVCVTVKDSYEMFEVQMQARLACILNMMSIPDDDLSRNCFTLKLV